QALLGRGASGLSLAACAKRPELVADEVERSDQDDRDGLRDNLSPPEPVEEDKQPDLVHGERSRRHDEEARSLPPEVALLVAEGPRRNHSTIESTRSESPSKTASTVPSGAFRTQPARPSDSARERASARKKTPWTRPLARTRMRFIPRTPLPRRAARTGTAPSG